MDERKREVVWQKMQAHFEEDRRITHMSTKHKLTKISAYVFPFLYILMYPETLHIVARAGTLCQNAFLKD